MSLKLRRYLSVWMLLVVYCFSVGGAAYAVLSCHCVEQETGKVHVCCRNCDVHTDCDAHSACFDASCCGVDHSRASELYTTVSSVSPERNLKIAIADLPALPAAEITSVSVDPVHGETVAERPFLAHSTVHLLSSGLRAPPVFM